MAKDYGYYAVGNLFERTKYDYVGFLLFVILFYPALVISFLQFLRRTIERAFALLC